MRTLVYTLLLAAVVVTPAVAQKKPTDKPEFKPGVKEEPEKKDEPKLKIGDPAPPLTVSKWHQGPEVKAFEKDTVYVIVFWDARSPHLDAALKAANAAQTKFKGVVPVAVSSGWVKPVTSGEPVTADEGQLRMEAEYLKGVKTKYTFGFANDPTGTTQQAYADQPGWSAGAVVVGKDGKVAFVCPNPVIAGLHLADVVGKVADGTWKGQADADAIDAVRKEYGRAIDLHGRLYQMRDELKGMTPEQSLDAVAKAAAESQKALDEFLKKHPEYLTEVTTLGIQVILATRAGDQKGAEKALAALLKPDLDIATVSVAGQVLNGVGRDAMIGGLKAEVAPDKLFGMLIDAVLKSDVVADGNGGYLMDIVRMSPAVGATDKGLELLQKLIDVSTEFPADKKPEKLKEYTKELRQQEQQMKEMKAKSKK